MAWACAPFAVGPRTDAGARRGVSVRRGRDGRAGRARMCSGSTFPKSEEGQSHLSCLEHLSHAELVFTRQKGWLIIVRRREWVYNPPRPCDDSRGARRQKLREHHLHGRRHHSMHKTRGYFSVILFGGLALLLGALLAVTTIRNIKRDRDLLMQNALTPGVLDCALARNWA